MEPTVEKKKLGRPFGTRRVKHTPETIDKILKGVRAGLTYKSAAINAGISESTLNLWTQKGREGLKPYTEFLAQLEEAVENGKAHLLALVHQHAAGGKVTTRTTTRTSTKRIDGKVVEETIDTATTEEKAEPNLKAACWILERRHAKDFGAKQEIALVNGDNPFQCEMFGSLSMGSGNEGEEGGGQEG